MVNSYLYNKQDRQKLIFDLYVAYEDARRHKAKKGYVIDFEKDLHKNILALAQELDERTYKAQPSTSFIIKDPNVREVFASDFRDRIVQHLYFNYTHEMFERHFIYDSYSCIKGRGTHFGISRLDHHIRSESRNYSRECYVLKMDIRGYFMHICRQLLCQMATDIILRKYADETTKELVLYLTQKISLRNPMEECRVIGDPKQWETLPKNKSLRYSPVGCGLAIGDLTSQLFSNVYLNALDQFCKRTLGFRHYGRYVDDSFVVSADRETLEKAIPLIKDFMKNRLRLELHMGKTRIYDVRNGVEFLGAYLKPNRKYISNQSLMRMKIRTEKHLVADKQTVMESWVSRTGVMSHYSTHNIKKHLFTETFI